MPISQADSFGGIAFHSIVDKDIRRITDVDNIVTVCVQKGDGNFIKDGLAPTLIWYCFIVTMMSMKQWNLLETRIKRTLPSMLWYQKQRMR